LLEICDRLCQVYPDKRILLLGMLDLVTLQECQGGLRLLPRIPKEGALRGKLRKGRLQVCVNSDKSGIALEGRDQPVERSQNISRRVPEDLGSRKIDGDRLPCRNIDLAHIGVAVVFHAVALRGIEHTRLRGRCCPGENIICLVSLVRKTQHPIPDSHGLLGNGLPVRSRKRSVGTFDSERNGPRHGLHRRNQR
jgi:hypothetical protein